jgi:hypothetical protein
MGVEPDYVTLHYDDAALANGTAITQDVPQPPEGYNYICAVYAQGAGFERIDLKTNDAYELQQIPAVDLAVDGNATQGEYGKGNLTINGMTILNQPCKGGKTKITLTPYCTGTAAAYVLIMFGKRPLGNQPYTLFKRGDTSCDSSSAAVGALMFETLPDESGPVKLTRLVGIYIHAATSNFVTVSMGRGGNGTDIPVRVGAVNTIEHPPVFYPVEAPIPNTINFGGKSAGGTGAALVDYYAFQ